MLLLGRFLQLLDLVPSRGLLVEVGAAELEVTTEEVDAAADPVEATEEKLASAEGEEPGAAIDVFDGAAVTA
jgi:hypothetical protein